MTMDHRAKTIHLAQLIGALSLEVNTGMRHSRGSVLRVAQAVHGVKAKNKRDALAELNQMYTEHTGRVYGS